MGIFTNKRTTKIVIISVLLLMILNILIPYFIYADNEFSDEYAQEVFDIKSEEEEGGELFNPFFKFFAAAGDLGINFLQTVFIGSWDIKDKSGSTFTEDIYTIRYSPGIIFSNEVPGLNADFINPKEDLPKYEVNKSWEMVEERAFNLDSEGNNAELTEKYGYDPKDSNVAYIRDSKMMIKYAYFRINWTDKEGVEYTLVCPFTELSEDAIEFDSSFYEAFAAFLDANDHPHWANAVRAAMKLGKFATKAINRVIDHIEENLGINMIEKFLDNYTHQNIKWTLYRSKLTKEKINEDDIKPVAKTLQPLISKWYKGLRLVAIVGLLSVLVYVGIRVIISSTGQEKAKYKKMIADWVTAICILFVLHYIMSFTMTMVDEILNIFKANVIDGGTIYIDATESTGTGSDILMSSLRNRVANGHQMTTVFAELICYLALVILTFVFTIQYLKRLVYLAFLTMIAPLIALTYPLDKIKDGQAQAFTLWIREYVFNALLPVIHMLIYVIFVTSSGDLALKKPIYAIACIAFIVPAEKFIRKMFGFDKASTVSPLGAAAGGAMVMNMVNNLKKTSSGGSDKGGGDNQSKVRTNGNGYIPAPGENNGSGSGGNGGRPLQGGNSPGGNQPGGNTQPGGTSQPGGNPPPGGTPQPGGNPPLQDTSNQGGSTFGESIESGNSNPQRSRWAGVKGVVGSYINKPTIKKAAIGAAKWTGRKFRRVAVGAAGAAAVGTIGLAAGVATGDLSKAAQFTGAAALVGYKKGNDIGNKLTKVEKENRELYKENKWGTDEYQTRKAIGEMENNREFLKTARAGNRRKKSEREALIRKYYANGITDQNKIINTMNTQNRINNMSEDEREAAGYGGNKVSDDEIIAAQKLSQGLSASYWGQPQNREKFKKHLTENKHLTDQEADRAIALISSLKGDLS